MNAMHTSGFILFLSSNVGMLHYPPQQTCPCLPTSYDAPPSPLREQPKCICRMERPNYITHESTRQVSYSWDFLDPVWLYARLGSKGKNSGPSGGEHGTAKTTSHCGLQDKP